MRLTKEQKLERELELMREDEIARDKDFLIKLCDTRLEYAVRIVGECAIEASDGISKASPLLGPFVYIGLFIAVPFAFLGEFMNAPKDEKTGKYILRYTD